MYRWNAAFLYFTRQLPSDTKLPIVSANEEEVVLSWDDCHVSFEDDESYAFAIASSGKYGEAEVRKPIPTILLNAISS